MIPIPNKQQLEWHRMERIMFVHYGPAAWQGREYDNHSTPLSEINPVDLDTDQWCEAAISWGAKMIIFVAKHVGGFCWWQTDTTEYSVKNTAWRGGKGDVMADISASCKKYGLKLGVYIYPGDDNWGAYIGSGGKTQDPTNQEAYNRVFRQQLIEVLTRYGEIFEVWFDGSCIIEVGDILAKHAPNAIVFQSPHANIRWCGTEEGKLPQNAWSTVKGIDLKGGEATVVQSTPDGDTWAPLEVDTTLYDHFWFWSPEKEKKRKSLEWLMRIYYQSVGRGGVLLLNASPNITGRIPEDDIKRYSDFGKEITRRFSNPIAETKGEGTELVLELDNKTMVNHAIISEDIAGGERVRAWRLEAQTDDGWKHLASGNHLGNKRICVFPEVTTHSLKLTVEQSVADPMISCLAAYYVQCDDLEDLITGLNEGISSYDPETGSWVMLETGETAYQWTVQDFDGNTLEMIVDLTPFIPRAGQYTVSIFPEERQKAQVLHITGIIEGNEDQKLVVSLKENESYNITRTAAIDEMGAQKTAVFIRLRMDKPVGGIVAVKPTL